MLKILAIFGLVFGAFGAQHALGEGICLLAPHDAFARAINDRNQLVRPKEGAADFERYSQREADVRYARRNAALPLDAAGLILSCLLFAGSLRALRRDSWGLSAWSLAATASLPYQLLSTTLTLVVGRDLALAFAGAPAGAGILALRNELATRLSVGAGALALLYFGVCALYLRSAALQRALSDGRKVPSA